MSTSDFFDEEKNYYGEPQSDKQDEESVASSTTTDEEITAVMVTEPQEPEPVSNNVERQEETHHRNPTAKRKQTRKKSPLRRRKKAPAEPVAVVSANGQRIVARCDLDGYFYAGQVVSASQQPGKVVVQYDDAPLKRADVLVSHVIQNTGAVSRPFIRQSNTVLVLIRNGVSGLYCYIPGVVALSPVSDNLQAKCYSVVAYNRRTVTAFRYQLIRISEQQFTSAVTYILERARLMGMRPLAPLTQKKHYGISIKCTKDESRPNPKSRIQSANRPHSSVSTSPRRSAAVNVAETAPVPIQVVVSSQPPSWSTNSPCRSGAATPSIDRAVQTPGSNQEMADFNQREPSEHSEMVDRAVSPISFLVSSVTSSSPTEVFYPTLPAAKPAPPNTEPVESSSSSSSEDDGKVVRPERRRRRFERSSPLDGTFKIGQTVLSRSSDDGWFYRWKVEADLGNGAYSLRSKSDPSDFETAWKEHIFPCPSKAKTPRDDDEEETEEQSKDERVVEEDFVIAKRPDFKATYCPGTVELIDHFSHEFVVRFCDQFVARVPFSGSCAKISQKAFNEAVMFMKHCEDRWIGERVVVLNPPKEEGGFEPVAGNYVIGIVKEHVQASGQPNKQNYLVELAAEVTAANQSEEERDDEEPFVIKQSIDHIFGRFTKSRKLNVGDFVLAPSDFQKGTVKRGCLIYLPGTVRAVKRNSKLLTVKLVNGLVVDSLKAKDVFWLRGDYFESAEHFYRLNHLPDALKGSTPKMEPLQPTHYQKPKQTPAPPKIVIEDFDKKDSSTTESPRSTRNTTPQSPLEKVKPGKDQVSEAMKRCEHELENGGPEQIVQWLRNGSVLATERLAEMAIRHNKTLARAIYIRAGLNEKALEGVDTKAVQRQLLDTLLALDSESAVIFAKKLSGHDGLLETDEVAQIFLASQRYNQDCFDFLMEAIDDDDLAHAHLENQLLDLSAELGKEHLNKFLSSGRFTRYDKTKAVNYCKKMGLYERCIEQLQFVDDIKTILGEHAFELDPDWLVKYFEAFTPDDMYDCIEEMLLSNKSGQKNLPVVVRLIKRFHRQLDVNNIVDLLERLQMQNELFVVLQTVLTSSRNPILMTKFIQVACKVDKISEAEQMCRDKNAIFVAEVVWEFLVEARLSKTGRLMALMCDRFNMVDQFVRFCHENNQYRLLEAFVSRINPGRLHDVVDALSKVGADHAVIDRVIAAVSPPQPPFAENSATSVSSSIGRSSSALSAQGGYIE